MIVCVESNFLLELAFEQEQSNECGEILTLAESKRITLAIPAFCFSVALERVGRRRQQRRELQQKLIAEGRELNRSSSARDLSGQIAQVAAALVENVGQGVQRLDEYVDRLSRCALEIPFSSENWAAAVRNPVGLSRHDSIVFASIRRLHDTTNPAKAVFLNRNSKDFETPGILAELQRLNCVLKPNFKAGLAWVQSELAASP